jgi:uncharacterized protein
MTIRFLRFQDEASKEAYLDECETKESVTIDNLNTIFADIVQRLSSNNVPSWEFMDGFISALICLQKPISDDEWLPVLFPKSTDKVFANDTQRKRFLTLLHQRQSHLREQLSEVIDGSPVISRYQPIVIDWRSLSKSELAEHGIDQIETLPPLGKYWAQGFLAVTTRWFENLIWETPMMALPQLLDTIVDVADDDPNESDLEDLELFLTDTNDQKADSENTSLPDESPNKSELVPNGSLVSDDDEEPTDQEMRGYVYGTALVSVFLIFNTAHNPGAITEQLLTTYDWATEANLAFIKEAQTWYASRRVQTVKLPKVERPGRNAPCPCGSGKKYKKCCGQEY